MFVKNITLYVNKVWRFQSEDKAGNQVVSGVIADFGMIFYFLKIRRLLQGHKRPFFGLMTVIFGIHNGKFVLFFVH